MFLRAPASARKRKRLERCNRRACVCAARRTLRRRWRAREARARKHGCRGAPHRRMPAAALERAQRGKSERAAHFARAPLSCSRSALCARARTRVQRAHWLSTWRRPTRALRPLLPRARAARARAVCFGALSQASRCRRRRRSWCSGPTRRWRPRWRARCTAACARTSAASRHRWTCIHRRVHARCCAALLPHLTLRPGAGDPAALPDPHRARHGRHGLPGKPHATACVSSQCAWR
jgi:hypothetical protein